MGLADAGRADCTKDEVLRLIDKGFDKKAIDSLCAGSAAHSANPAAPATDAVSVIGALLKLVETASLDDKVQLDKSFAALGLSFSNQEGDRRMYEGVLTDMSVKANAIVGANDRQFELYDRAPAQNTSLKDKYYVALKAAQIFAAQHGWSLSDVVEPSYTYSCPMKVFGKERKTASGSAGDISVGYHLGWMIPRYSCEDGTPKDADSYSDGSFSLGYSWHRR